MRPVGRGAAAVEEIAVSPSVSAYCRQARRLRGTLAHQPARMHRKLRELVVPARDAASGERQVASTPRPTPSKAHAFADHVAAGLDGPVLRYATRKKLLADARRLGIGDFEANLVIAAVQHQRRRDVEPAVRRASATTDATAWYLASLVLVIAVDSLLALGVWRVFAV